MTTSDWTSAADLLYTGIEKLNLQVDDQQQLVMIEFLKLLEKWNKAFNLTSINRVEEMVIKHLLDSLSVNPWVLGPSVLDVGTGAGIPGMPLAIANPEIRFTLLDTNGKKTRFIKQACVELGVRNVKVVQARIESFKIDDPFAQIICRAYSAISKFVDQTRQLLHDDVELLAMKGLLPASEIADLKNDSELSQVVTIAKQIELQVPFLDEQRHLVILKSFNKESQ
ncbi:MAG: 16S rRNA (guanine(527)-N(7))-methyltransferase RsmG [Pseudomonadales bacterium]|nr:16S rRNA (guanine(527)-N(7))-methyltransferase RsmG [Pseudomonadales bacterium]